MKLCSLGGGGGGGEVVGGGGQLAKRVTLKH